MMPKMADDPTGKVVNFDPQRRGGNSEQQWEARSRYPPEAFIVPGQDHTGQSERVFCRVTPSLAREIAVIFESRKFPFRTKGDLMRWCVKVGVERLLEMEPSPGSIMAQVDTIDTVLREESEHVRFGQLFDNVASVIGTYVQAGAHGEARRVLFEVRAKVERIGNQYWRERYLKELGTRFGHLISNAAGVPLGIHLDDGEE